MKNFILFSFILVNWASLISGHGRLMDPPARSTAWREDSSRFPAYYNDMEMFCGGKPVQWNENSGKCSICGENWAKPKRFEKGGDLYRGHVVRNYQMNGKIPISVELTTNHRGWFEFRLCNVDTMPSGEADHDCLNKILLADQNGRTRFNTPSQVEGWQGFFNTELVIPKNFKCNHCVLQWKWNVGNSHGYDFNTGEYCLGCGPQEQFYGCSDIRIVDGIFITTAAPTQKPQTVHGSLYTQVIKKNLEKFFFFLN